MQLNEIKKALITGATSDLGIRVAEQLASRGVELILTAKSKESLLELKQVLQKKTAVTTHIGNLLKDETRKEIATLINEHKPELIINNAGKGLYGPALMHTIEEQIEIVDINANALLEITLAGAKMLKRAGKRGIILNISSAASFFSYPTFCVYSASKAFVTNFSRGLDQELKNSGIRILCACPGQIETAFRVKAAKNYPQRPARGAISSSKAARLLLKQIEKEKALYVFNWHYRLGLFLAHYLFPSALVEKFLQRVIRKRYPTTSV
ncbi:MAG: SDR family NAD(P)-dependent oxidoreductase [Candidatus Algichlamydia australiensis]|nr:SDR family NAD(P)-dependent oxidoreductase [Chlamydiales bacterium]